MKFLKYLPILLAFSTQLHATVACNGFGVCTTTPGVVSGVMGNYDIANDTGVPAYGFEMDYENAHSSEVGFTWDWSRFGAPTIGEYTDAKGVPHAVVRYQSPKDANGNWTVHTIPATFPWSTGGHSCTSATTDTGCEHFVTGMFASTTAQPTVVKYNWLVDAGNGTLTYGTGIGQPAPGATMAIPALQAPAPVQPPAPAQPAPVQPVVVQMVPVQPAPAEKAPKPAAQWGDPVWLKVTKTSAHGKKPGKNAADVVNMLVDEDKDGKNGPDWQNAEPAQVESEWYLIQSPPDGQNGGAKQQHNGAAEQVGNDETVTRKYEWFDNVAPVESYDSQTHEQMCDAVAADGVHGSQTKVGITGWDPTIADTYSYDFDCSKVQLVGNFLAANMVAFENVMPLTQLEKIADVKVGTALAKRTTIFGGNSPYFVTTEGVLPNGIVIDGTNGIISGTPTVAGEFNFNVNVTDSDGAVSTHAYTVNILDAAGQKVAPVVPVAPVASVANQAIYDGTVGVEYSTDPNNGGVPFQLTTTGGTSPYTYTINGLPAGISFDNTMTLTGVPTTVGVFPFTVMAKDAKGAVGNSLLFNLRVSAPPAACSGVKEKILQFTQLRSANASFTTPNQMVRFMNAATTMNGTATFAVNELATYSGVKDPTNVFCVADTLVVDPVPAVCNPPLTVLDAATNTCVAAPAVVCNNTTQVRDPATNTCVAAPPVVCNNTTQVRDPATNTCVVAPPVVCGVNQVRDATTNTCVPAPVVAPTSCVAPAGSKSASDIHAKLTAVNGKQLIIGSKIVTLLDCAKVTYKGTAKAPVVGYDADANKGYILNGVTYTTAIIIDDGK